MTPADFAILLAVLWVVWVLGVLWLLRGMTLSGTLGARDALIVAATGSVGVLAQVVVTTDRTHSAWHVMSVLYLDLVVAVPLLAGVLIFCHTLARRRLRDQATTRLPLMRTPLVVLSVVALLPAAVGWHATHVAPYDLTVDRVTLADTGRTEGAPLRIGVLSDLQTESVGGYERRAVDLLMAQDPDIVVIPGDLFQAGDPTYEANRPALVELLRTIEAPGGVFMVDGDVDGGRLSSLAEDTGITHLRDQVVRVDVGGRELAIAGMRLHPGVKEDRAHLELAGIDDGALRVLLAHRPDWIRLLPEDGADLVIAGHTHGGQVAIPWFGPPLTHSALPRHVADGGLGEVDGIPIYVSTGVGHEQKGAPQVRFLTRPSVGVVDLAPEALP